MFYDTIKAARLMDFDIVEACNLRIKFLYSQYSAAKYLASPASNEITKAFMDLHLEKIDAEIKYLHKYRRQAEEPAREGEITDEHIQQAKAVPIDSIIEFNRSGKALAFCHEDTHPSLSLFRKANIARCFVCNESFDTIAVLMQRDHMSFHSAVRNLAGI